MAYQEKPGDGTLCQNKEVKTDKAPTHTGYITAHRDIKAGEKVRLAGWRKGGKDGKDPFLSLKMSDDRQREEQSTRQPPPADPF